MEFKDCRPFFKGYELLGDSHLVRFALQCELGPPNVRWARRLGMCVSGITVKGLIEEILQHGVSSKVLVFVGTNDMLAAARSSSPRQHMRTVRGHLEQLKKVLSRRCSHIVSCTLPFIPRLLRFPRLESLVDRMNRGMSSWSDGEHIVVLPVKDLFTKEGCPDVDLYERFFGSKKGRVDLIHFNKAGNEVLHFFFSLSLCAVQRSLFQSAKLAAAARNVRSAQRQRLTAAQTQDAQTITEVCSGGELPEVEIISLLNEQIPQYRLRADTLTQFTGYENQDWFIPSPALKPEETVLLPDQIRETLNYFLLCSNRVSQMTKTYNDIEAVTRLLEEKEKDLELTARIGKELLANNQKLEATVSTLEAELRGCNEKLTQLSHELLKKTELIQILTNDEGDSSSEAGTPTGVRGVTVEFMQRRVGQLEDENKKLLREANQLARDTDECEEAEKRLVLDVAEQLSNVNREVEMLTSELERQREENRQQTDHITVLCARLKEMESKYHAVAYENDELRASLQIARETQDQLATELLEVKGKNNEVTALLVDTQEQLKRQRKKGVPTARGGALFSSLSMSTHTNPDSIASELESSLFSELSLDSGISADRVPSYRKVFETVRCASRSSVGTNASSPAHPMYPRPYVPAVPPTEGLTSSYRPRMSSFVSNEAATRSQYSSFMSFPSLDSTGQSDTDGSFSTDSEDNFSGVSKLVGGGVPRALELEAAVRRLTPAELHARRARLSAGPFDEPSFLPLGCRTPDSIMSTGSSGAFSGQSGSSWKMPDKLQIVKPIEGSLTLHHWAQLATPTLGGLLEERPGVKIRGGKPLEELGVETYTLEDLEEDDERSLYPGKSFQSTGAIYTYTNSTVMHPDDTTSVTHSLRGSQMCTGTTNSRQSTAPVTPLTGLSRRNSTTTFSTCLGLAKMLNERGIKAATPSAINTPCNDKSFSPTATPCNSPDASTCSSRSPSPPPYANFQLPAILSSGAEYLRRTFSSDPAPTSHSSRRPKRLSKSRTERKSLQGIRLVEKIEQFGLDNIVATCASPMPDVSLCGTIRSVAPVREKGFKPKSAGDFHGKASFMIGAPGEDVSSDEERKTSKTPALGVPARPGTGQLDTRLNQLKKLHQQQQTPKRPSRSVRPDLGCVPKGPPLGTNEQSSRSTSSNEASSSTLGTLSSLWFGRKGGLL